MRGGPLLEAVGVALTLGATPLLRELRELAHRALITLPPEVEERLARPEDSPTGPRRGHREPGPGRGDGRVSG